MTLLKYKLWLGCLLTVTTLNACFALTITRDGGYENIVIAISNDTQLTSLEEQTNLINNLKSLLQTTSNSLYAASTRKFYFKNAVILVPQTWQANVGRTDGPYLYKKADVRVVGTKGPQPYVVTQQPKDCGEPGEFIQIKNPDMFFRMICPACAFLKHWAQYRYGIFDESGIKGSKVFPPVYRDTDGWNVTGCDYPYPYTFSKPEYFCPPKDGFTGRDFTSNSTIKLESSIMSGYSGTNQATTFCGGKHNSIAPTPQNAFCKHRSTLEIINESNDFKMTSTTSGNVPQISIQVFKRNEVKAVIVLDSALCKKEISKTVAYSIAKSITSKFQAEILGILIGNKYIGPSVADVSQIFLDECTNNYDRENLTKAAEVIQKTSKENFGAIIFIANGNLYHDQTRIDFLNNTLYKNIRLHVVAYPPLAYKLINPDFNQHRYTVHSIPMDYNTSAACDLQARVTFDQIFHSIFSLYTNDYSTARQMISAPIYANETITSTKRINLQGHLSMTVYFCNPMGLPHLEWDEQDWELKAINTAHTAETAHPKEIQPGTSNVNYTFNPGEEIPYALTFWMEGKSGWNDLEFRTSIEPAKFPKENSFPGMPPKIRAFTNLNLPYVHAVYTDVNNETFKLKLWDSSQIGRGTVYEKTFSGNVIRFSTEPTTYSVVIEATDNLDHTLATHTIQLFTTFSTTMTEPYYNYFPPNRITDLAVVDILHNNVNGTHLMAGDSSPDNIVTFQWTQSGHTQDSEFARDYYLRCKTYQGSVQEEFEKIELEAEMLNKTEVVYKCNWPQERTGVLYYCTVKAWRRLFNEPSNMVTVYVPPCLLDQVA